MELDLVNGNIPVMEVKDLLKLQWINSEATLKRRLETYIDDIKKRWVVPTLQGIANSLGLSREKVRDYKVSDVYGQVICLYRDKARQYFEEILVSKDYSTSWVSLRLKNNAGYTDKVEVENNAKVSLSLSELHDIANKHKPSGS